MDRNTTLAFALSLLVFSGYLSWEASQLPPPSAVVEEVVEEEPPAAGAEAKGDWSGLPGRDPSPEPRPVADAKPTPATSPTPAPPGESVAQPWNEVFESDLYRVGVDNRGGGITSWRLRDERYTVKNEERKWVPIELVTRQEATPPLFASPLEDLGIGNLSDAVFTVDHASNERVEFSLRRGDVEVRKELRFRPDEYEFDLSLEVTNHSNRVLESDLAVLWPGAVAQGNDFTEQSLVALVGDDVERVAIASVGSPGFLAGIFGGAEEGPATYDEGAVEWAGVDIKFFVSALIPNEPAPSVTFTPTVKGEVASIVLPSTRTRIDPGTSIRRTYRAYIGPKTEKELESVGADLGLSVNLGYSWLEPLTIFFHWLLLRFYSVIPNYGVAIILVTLLVRLITMPIMSRQMKSMERMRELQPRIKEIQEKFKEDRQRQSEEQMKLYKETGVNPLGGCFPMLLQFPVFIGLFFALQSSIQLRHAPFMLWIDDLSAPEELFMLPGIGVPIRLLPLMMGASMVLQQRMTPMTGMDPAQARMMTTIMPIMMTVLFYQFPSGLVLYWFVSNLLGIAHQLWVRRNLEEAKPA